MMGVMLQGTFHSCDGLPLSVQSSDPLIYSRFSCVSRDEFLGTLNTHTHKLTKVFPGDLGLWERLPLFYAWGQFWSSDHSKVLCLSAAAIGKGNAILIANRKMAAMLKWTAPRGVIRSWMWQVGSRGCPNILTVHPGTLWLLDTKSHKGLPLPALDKAYAAMLSPAGDRAIGFEAAQTGIFLVCFSKASQKRRIPDSQDHSLSGKLIDWAVWSPHGTRVALVAHDSGSNLRTLYVGDPAVRLRKVDLNDLRFPTSSDSQDQLCGLTAVWGRRDDRLFCVLVKSRTGRRTKSSYVMARISLRS